MSSTESIRTTTTDVTPDTREMRALDLYRERGHLIRRASSEVYEVPSCTLEGKRYEVRYGGSEESCSCPDYQRRGHSSACKHLLAVGIHHAKRRGESRRRRVLHTCSGCGERAGSISKGTGFPLIRDGADRWYHVSCKPVTRVEGL